jgi:Flp pilus assembly protein TadD
MALKPRGEMQLTNISDTMSVAVRDYEAGRLNQAEQLCREVLCCDAHHPDALHLSGAIAYRRGQYDEAIELIREAIARNRHVPRFHNTFGAVLKAMGKFEEAIAAYEQAVLLNAEYTQAHHNMGNVFLLQGRYAAAVEKYDRVVSLDPECIEAYNSMAVALQYQGEYAAAIEKCNQALSLKPDYAEAYNTVASVLMKKGCCAEAVENYRHALQLKPDYAEAHCNLGITLLLSGRFEEGWAEYEWRLRTEKAAYPRRHQTAHWDGSSFAGKRLLVHYEQGFGDNIQFIRYLPMVKRRGGTVICEMLQPLTGLLRGFPAIDELIEASSDGAPAVKFDYYVPLLDLPRIFGTVLETIPADVPYLHADPARARYWQQRLAGTTFKVGIVWAGKPVHPEDRARSCHLRHCLGLSKIPGVRLLGLQKGIAADQVRDLAAEMSLVNLGDELNDFTDTAAVIENLDLVVSVDTAVLHLAGAMGKPVWAILPSTPDWRWMLDRQDSPWYPTMRLFRQRSYGDWEDVFQRVSRRLEMLASGQGPILGSSRPRQSRL